MAVRPVDLARAVGVGTHTVRRYEQWGVLPPSPRSDEGHRQYGPNHLAAIRAMRALKAGFGWKVGLAVLRSLNRGDLVHAARIVDGVHARLDRERLEAERIATVLGSLQPEASQAPLADLEAVRLPDRLRIGEVAALLDVPRSTLRHWERVELLISSRDDGSRYRQYDRGQLHLLRLVALLRRAGCSVPDVRSVLTQLADRRVDVALATAQARMEGLDRQSVRCLRATAELWAYVSMIRPAALDEADYEEHYAARHVEARGSDADASP